jgi:hypothetical protein
MTTNEVIPDASVKIRGEDYGGIRAISYEFRMSISDVISALRNGWHLLTPEQRIQAIRRDPPSEVVQPTRHRKVSRAVTA